MTERLIQDAVIRTFEVIGDAASRLSPTLREQPGLPWRKIIAFRNGYWSVDLLLAWDVVVNELPKLKADIARLLAELSGPSRSPSA